MNKLDYKETVGKSFAARANASDYDVLAQYLSKQKDITVLPESTQILIRRDYEIISKVHVSDDNLEHRLNNAFKVALETYKDLGFKIPNIPLKLVADFPSPYNDSFAKGLLVDYQDARDLNVDAGLYIKSSNDYSFLSEHLVCHEFAHSLFSFVDSQELVRGYEEGVVDFLALLPLAHLFGENIAINIILTLRSYRNSSRINIYSDAIRQVAGHILFLGEEGWLRFLIEIQTKGRDMFLVAEKNLLEFNITQLSDYLLPTKSKTSILTKLAVALASMPTSYVLSPEAYLVAEKAEIGMKKKELYQTFENILSREEIDSALQELRSEFFLVLLHNGEIISNESGRYLDTKACRYYLD